MKPGLTKHYFLVFSLAFLAVAFLLRHFSVNEQQNQNEYAQKVEKRINQRLSVIDDDLEDLASHLQSLEEFTFSNLDRETKYPYYIFNEGKLAYWSDFKIIPEYNGVAGDYAYRYLSLKGGQYIAVRREFNHQKSTFEVYSFLPVVSLNKINNSYIESGFNTEIFSNSSIIVKAFSSPGDADILTDSGQYLFSIDFLRGFHFVPIANQIGLIILILGSIVFFLLYLRQIVVRLVRSETLLKAFFILTGGLIALRLTMLYAGFPFSLVEIDLFNSRYFASSIFNPSLGDLFLNNLVLFILVYFLARHAERIRIVKIINGLSSSAKPFAAAFLIFLSFATLFFQFYIIKILYLHSQWSLDITQSIQFTSFKILSVIIFFMNAAIYFLVSHAIFKLVKRLVPNAVHLLGIFVVMSGILLTATYWSEGHLEAIIIVNSLYLLILYFFDLPESFIEIKYRTFLYFFAGAMASAIIGAFAVYTFEQLKNINTKNQIANQLLIDNDIRGEYLLAEAADKIRNDIFIKNRLYSPFYSKEIIEQKIRRVYLGNYLDRYDIQVYLFNAQGVPYPNYTIPGLSVFVGAFAHKQYATDYPGIFFVNEANLSSLNRYLVFIEIQRYGNSIGYVVLDLKLKKIIPNSVYPELIVDKRFVQPYGNENYSYAIFQDNQLMNNAGNFNYQKDLSESLLGMKGLLKEGIIVDGFHHLGIMGSGGKLIVVSSEVYPLRNILANFSFLFLVLVFLSSLIILLDTYKKGKGKVTLNFASKIQLYLNLAFFLPLLIISVSTLSLISSSYHKDIIQRYNSRAESISNNIVNSLDSFVKNQLGREQLSNELVQIARYSEADINLFNTNGRLISTSQPTIYENDLLSEFINPDALAMIKEQRNDRVILEEQVGELVYKSAYVAVKSFETGELMGILSIPFFESQYELEKEIIDILTNIMNVFTFIFIIILIVSYFASKALTFPLKFITQKIKRTSLAAYNEPLVWQSEDEIGLLVGEYNRMLENLEESKQALSKSEKESAWREMAKQVAHEIKNPLTPMKLTLQHLQRLLLEPGNTHKETVDRSIKTLLQQIETLSDIATSFSSFAKMPMPRQERFDIVPVLRKTVTLFNNEKEAVVTLDCPAESLFVEGDSQLMGRIFSNLIINGIQAVPSSRTPRMDIVMEIRNESTVLIKFKDNGEGISASIQDKIFVPNFSTKYAGSGIGLAIAKRGIEHAGGTIWYETEAGEGTTFFVEIPILK